MESVESKRPETLRAPCREPIFPKSRPVRAARSPLAIARPRLDGGRVITQRGERQWRFAEFVRQILKHLRDVGFQTSEG